MMWLMDSLEILGIPGMSRPASLAAFMRSPFIRPSSPQV